MQIELIEKLNGGAYGDVFRARDNDLDRLVAVKVIRSSCGDKAFVVNQAKALARAPHPNIVSIFGICEVIDPETGKECCAIAMELLTDRTLQDVYRKPLLAPDFCRRIGEGIIDGVEHLHRHGVAHGDIHSENIIVDEAGHAKLIDALYYDTLALLSTRSREARTEVDRDALRTELRGLLGRARIDHARAAKFSNSVGRASSLQEIKEAFARAFGPPTVVVAREEPIVPKPQGINVVETAKRFLSHERYKIRLHDLINELCRDVAKVISGTGFEVGTPAPDKDSIPERAARYELATEKLVPAIHVLGYWAKDDQSFLIGRCVAQLSQNESKSGITYDAWVNMTQYPALITLFSAGTAACASYNVAVLRRLLLETLIRQNRLEKYVTQSITTWRTMNRQTGQLLPGVERRKTPVSDRLFDLLARDSEAVGMNIREYEEAFDTFEVLKCLICHDSESDQHSAAPLGRFAWKVDAYGFTNRIFSPKQSDEFVQALLTGGFFGGNFERMQKAATSLKEQISRSGMQW